MLNYRSGLNQNPEEPEMFFFLEDTLWRGALRVMFFEKPCAEITSLFINENFRGKGHGRDLVGLAVRKLRAEYPGCHYLEVLCEQENLGFYRKCGFVETFRFPACRSGETFTRMYFDLKEGM